MQYKTTIIENHRLVELGSLLYADSICDAAEKVFDAFKTKFLKRNWRPNKFIVVDIHQLSDRETLFLTSENRSYCLLCKLKLFLKFLHLMCR